jgi:hypothetical protein
MNSKNFIRGMVAEAAVPAYRFVKPGATDGSAVLAVASTDFIVGASEGIDSAIGEMCDVIVVGVVEVQLGGPVTRGGPVTANATGQAVAAAPAAGVNARIGGFALLSGVSGDVVPVLLAPGVIQG